ncbi:MAG TPA: aspartate carbamoyltransferase catalytic subunit [Gammaproteobacteria bacterium]|nr:aspartate carbamoyltransferase catalytic subunit [Gammaproteobacteria bacterium]
MNNTVSPQFDAQGRLRHLLTLDAMPAAEIEALLAAAEPLIATPGAAADYPPALAGRTVATLFFEPSTRTRCSFELAAKRLGADVINLGAAGSSTVKGESLADTLHTLEAMNADLLIVRHTQSGICEKLAALAGPQTAIVNAGEGHRDHPTQGLLDALTIQRHKPDFANLSIAIIGDIAHSRVARSSVAAFTALGATDLRLVGPAAWLPDDPAFAMAKCCTALEEGIDGADIVMALRIQKERMSSVELPDSDSYFDTFGLTEKRLAAAAPDAIVMHPGPMNRGIEIDDEVADGPRSVIREQVRNGLAVRMAVMMRLLENRANQEEVLV